MASNVPYMLAPGASASSPTPLRCPGADDVKAPWPALDDHLVQPEVSRDEVVRGRRIEAMAANPPHADQQCRLAYLINAHVRPGFVVSTELLTRIGPKSDFATDVCIRKDGIDKDTGIRYLEELASEVVSEQSLGDITRKAEDMVERGVRRVFAIFVKTNEVKEWRGAWTMVEREIEDVMLARAVPVLGLANAAAADDAVVRALLAKGNQAILQIRREGVDEGHRAGVDEGHKAALFTLLSARGFDIPPAVRARVEASQDRAELIGWIARAATATGLDAVFPA